MNEETHTALIVEDDHATAEMLSTFVRSLGHRARVARSLVEVEEALKEGTYCYVLLDKQLPAAEDKLAVVATGDLVQRRIRSTYRGRHPGPEGSFYLPMIVITGYASTARFAVHNLQLGATSFLAKPVDAETVTQEIVTELRRSRREDHGECAALREPGAERPALATPAPPPVVPSVPGAPLVVLTLDGLRIGPRRTSFLVNGKRRDLQDGRFAVLLRLSALRLRGSADYLTLTELGIGRSAETIARIQDAFESVVPEGFSTIENGEPTMRRLHPLVAVDRIDWATLERHPSPKIQQFAAAQRRRR